MKTISQKTSNLARALIKNVGAYNVTENDIAKYGGRWSEDIALYVFPDGSHGAFTDFAGGGAERDGRGEPILHFAAEQS